MKAIKKENILFGKIDTRKNNFMKYNDYKIYKESIEPIYIMLTKLIDIAVWTYFLVHVEYND